MDRPYGPVHSRGAEVAKHPTGVYLQVGCVQGEQASPFFFSFKKKGAKKNAPSGKERGNFARCDGRPGRRPGPATLWKGRPQTLDPTGVCAGRKVVPGVLDW